MSLAHRLTLGGLKTLTRSCAASMTLSWNASRRTGR